MAALNVLSGTFAGRYTIERELGRGASATVYLARDAQRGRAVAIKVLRPELAQSVGAERFLREIQVNEQLHHPHIVPVLDSGQLDAQLYFVLPQMEGGSLRQLLEREKQLPIEVAISITRTIADALDYAHRQKLIHRDVKPENILFTSGQACLADFGIARAIERAIDESTTYTGLVRGTPAYMSPEQASGSSTYDGRSDIYSLALVLYEMLAGVPAFIGPTPEAVIAMRFQHKPRELRVYRSTVSPAIQAVMDKALSLTAADRYGTAAEFAAALDAAPRAPVIESRTSGAGFGFRTPKGIATTGAAAFGVLALALVGYMGKSVLAPTTVADPTHYAILPIESDSGVPMHATLESLHRAFSRWRGISVTSPFEMTGAAGADAPLSVRDAVRAAKRAGVGRYVRARLAGDGARVRLTLGVFDSDNESAIGRAVSSPAVTSADLGLHLDALVAQLLVGDSAALSLHSRDVPAVMLYQRALVLREAFDLAGADSLVTLALEIDPAFPEAALLLAQVRAWRRQPPANWRPWSERAVASDSLSSSNRELARAMLAMANGDSPRACATLQRVASQSRRDFAAWYDLGTCLWLDTIVVRDPGSPSGWRFRSSYHRAALAFTNAFERAPAMHRSFQPGAFSQLRELLYADVGLVRPGVNLPPDVQTFYAYPAWEGDSLLFVPYPSSAFGPSLNAATIASARTAAAQQRTLFARIARSWAAALPNNAYTKEAVAVSLDLLGDPRGLDTLVVARRMALDADDQARLAATEVFLRVALGRSDASHLDAAARLGDSLLQSPRPADRETVKLLSRVAALLGRCRLAAHLSARSTHPAEAIGFGITQAVYEAADSLTVLTAVGCQSSGDSTALRLIEDGLQRAKMPESRKSQLRAALLGRLARLSAPGDSLLIRQLLRQPGANYLLQAQLHMLRGESAQARGILEAKRRVRGAEGNADISSDALLAESRLWLALGDTATAIQWIEPLLDRASWLQIMIASPVGTAALARLIALRSQLAHATGDRTTASRWAAFPSALWSSSDGELRGHHAGFRRSLSP